MSNTHTESAFTLEPCDRFKCMITSDPVKYEAAPDHETIISFFVIRRGSGKQAPHTYEIVSIVKTFKGDECVSRAVQTKKDITAARIDMEIANIRKVFAQGIQDATCYNLFWNSLDLSEVKSIRGQIKKIKAWGRVGVSTFADIPPMNLN